ncbi:MAG: DUF4278 domain-containing protein [Cyanobacteria bacterium P01_G01_bin.67]
MQLRYRGISYEYNPTQINLGERTNSVNYRGNNYNLNSVLLTLKDKNQEEIIYRGVAYTEDKQTKFLGQNCDTKTVCLTVKKKKIKFLGNICHPEPITVPLANATV